MFKIAAFITTLALASVTIAVTLARHTLAVITVKGDSMWPTLSKGDRVLVLCRGYRRQIQKNIVVIVTPVDPSWMRVSPLSAQNVFIKRIVMTGNNSITTSIAEVAPGIEREVLRKDYDATGHRRWYIPHNHVFVRSDNPCGGIDSATWGPLPLENVLGTVLMKLP
jgi:signal peptidase I